MKRLALSCIALVALSATALGQNAPADIQYLETLQARIAALESRMKQLESGVMNSSKITTPPKAKAEPPKTQPSRPAASPKKQAKADSPRKSRNYQIQEGDTISEIARMHGIPRSALMEANKMREGQQIYIGDQIVIPSPPGADKPAGSATMASGSATSGTTQFTTYTVKYGDTLSSIARKSGVSVTEIKSANSMKSDSIAGGQKLKIPSRNGNTKVASNTAATPSQPDPPTKKESASSAGGKSQLLLPDETYGLYTVERGDTVFSLARDFLTSEAEIRRLNEMGNSNTLKPGSDLVVPTSKYFEHHNLASH